jgi:hypothetical protein
MGWLLANREWLFSGVLVALPIAFIGWLIAKRYSKSLSQKQKAGNKSVNIQVGGNFEVEKFVNRSDSKGGR